MLSTEPTPIFVNEDGSPYIMNTSDRMPDRSSFNDVIDWIVSECDAIKGSLPFRYANEDANWGRINGAAVYDYSAGKYLRTAFLPPEAAANVRQVLDAFPSLAVEIYHDDNTIHAVRANALSRRRLHLTHAPTEEAASLSQVPQPFSKLVFPSEDTAVLDAVESFIASQPWSRELSVMRSAEFLLECTARGADKGGMTAFLAEYLFISPEHLYCIGDHANDVSMLQRARIPFAPANAIDVVKQVPGVHVLPHCTENAVAAMIAELDRLY